MAVSRSAEAVVWLAEDLTRTKTEAAEKFGIHKGTVTNAWKRRKISGACPCCGQTMRMGDKPGGPKKEKSDE